MSHAPHAFQPPAYPPQQSPAGFNPRHAMRPTQQPAYAPAPQGHAPQSHTPYPQVAPYGAPPQGVPQAMGAARVQAPAQAYAPYPTMPHQPTPMAGLPLSKKDARRAAKAQKALEKQQKLATKKSSPIIPFMLGLIVGAILTTYLSNSLFATPPLDGPAWTLPSSDTDAPVYDELSEDDLFVDEGDQ